MNLAANFYQLSANIGCCSGIANGFYGFGHGIRLRLSETQGQRTTAALRQCVDQFIRNPRETAALKCFFKSFQQSIDTRLVRSRTQQSRALSRSSRVPANA